MTKREAVRILMTSPGYFSCDLGTRHKLVEDLCIVGSTWFRDVIAGARGKPGMSRYAHA